MLRQTLQHSREETDETDAGKIAGGEMTAADAIILATTADIIAEVMTVEIIVVAVAINRKIIV